MKKILLLAPFALTLINCSRTDESSTDSTTTSTTQTTQTSVKMNVVNSQNQKQPGIIVMMFKTKVTNSSNLPTIEKQVISDANGLANFDLSSYISSDINQKYYFEAFKLQNNNYVWISTTHPEIDIKKNTQITTSIIVN